MLLSATSSLGQIIIGLIVAAIVGAIALARRYLSRPIFRMLVRVGKKVLPDKVRPLALKNADALIPTWRSAGGIARPSFEYRLHEVREKRRPKFAIVGGVYMDIRLKPVDIGMLKEGEFSILHAVRMNVGGSAALVGRYLHGLENDDQRSHLYTRLGGDALTNDLKKQLKKEKWMKRRSPRNEDSGLQCGVSVHLLSQDEQTVTTLTHRGSLGSFKWQQFAPQLARRTKRGGLIYVSGFFRTELHEDMHESIQGLPAKTVVCIDHGRFQPSDFVRVGAALISAFRSKLIDVYLCDHRELRDFASASGADVKPDATVLDLITCSRRANLLPAVTVVRGEPDSPSAVAHLAYRDDTARITPSRTHEVSLPSQNSFNARFIRELARGPSYMDVEEALKRAVHYALQPWNPERVDE